MIDPNKTYQTKGGREWRWYGENGKGQIPIPIPMRTK